MSNWNNERKCETCGKITRKRKHINCPECGGNLILINDIKIETISSAYYPANDNYPITAE